MITDWNNLTRELINNMTITECHFGKQIFFSLF